PGAAILVWLGGTRFLEGAAAGASIPSILGYIASASSSDEALRGRVVSRFEAATLAGLGLGIVVGPALFGAIGPIAFVLNALVYAGSFAIYRSGGPGLPEEARSRGSEARQRVDPRADFARPRSRPRRRRDPTRLARDAGN